MTDEERQRLEQIQKRRQKVVGLPWKQFNGSDISGVVKGENEAVCRVFAQPLKAKEGRGISAEEAAANLDFLANSAADIDFLLSREKKVAELTRSACVEKVKAVADQHREMAEKFKGKAIGEMQLIRAEECDILARSLESLSIQEYLPHPTASETRSG